MKCGNCGICGDEFHSDGIFIKQMVIPDAGIFVPQHSHVYDHTTMVAKGLVKVWVGEQELGLFEAPSAIFIKAHQKHTFLSLKSDCILYCIHKDRGNGAEVFEEHSLQEHV
jgi:quercetin dioxygenase-like cupin family protein